MAINYSNFKVTRKLRDKQSSTLGALNALNHILSLPNGLPDRFAVYQKCHSDLYSPLKRHTSNICFDALNFFANVIRMPDCVKRYLTVSVSQRELLRKSFLCYHCVSFLFTARLKSPETFGQFPVIYCKNLGLEGT